MGEFKIYKRWLPMIDIDDPDFAESTPDLGACCACGGFDHVRNVFMLDQKAPVPGTGWGCLVCHLPNDGAIAVLCDACADVEYPFMNIKFAVDGMPADKKRIPIIQLSGEHKHDMRFHPGDW